MSQTFDLILKGGIVVNHDGMGERDVAIRDGRIVELGHFSADQAGESLDCTGLHILPGVIDTQVHLREPGLTHKEDLETGGRAAVAGGVTGVFEMPNTNPLTTSAEALADKVARATNRMYCDFAFFVGGTRENVKHIRDLEHLPGSAGIKVFMGSSTGDLLVEDDAGVAAILAQTCRRVAFHSEDEYRLRDRMNERIEGDAGSHPIWRDEQVALISTQRLIRIAREAGKRIHVLHISTAEELPLLAANKDVASMEITPNHLTIGTPEDYARLGSLIQMNPPVRGVRHQQALWAAIQSGLCDVLGSDHAPHTKDEKAKTYPASPSGMPGVQTYVPIMLNHVNEGRLSLERFVDLSSHGPARLFGIARKGRIAQGHDADFTIVDMKARRTITNDWIESRCGWTPYDGKQVTGWPIGTMLRGRKVMWQGEILGQAFGQPITFQENPGRK